MAFEDKTGEDVDHVEVRFSFVFEDGEPVVKVNETVYFKDGNVGQKSGTLSGLEGGMAALACSEFTNRLGELVQA